MMSEPGASSDIIDCEAFSNQSHLVFRCPEPVLRYLRGEGVRLAVRSRIRRAFWPLLRPGKESVSSLNEPRADLRIAPGGQGVGESPLPLLLATSRSPAGSARESFSWLAMTFLS